MPGLAEEAAPKVNAKTLRQKDRTRTILRRARRTARTKGATGSYGYTIYAEGNLSGFDGGIVDLRFTMLVLFVANC